MLNILIMEGITNSMLVPPTQADVTSWATSYQIPYSVVMEPSGTPNPDLATYFPYVNDLIWAYVVVDLSTMKIVEVLDPYPRTGVIDILDSDQRIARVLSDLTTLLAQ